MIQDYVVTDNKTVAARIKSRREELGLTQDELAKKMGLADRSSISKIEKSGNNISLKMLDRIAVALDTTPATLSGINVIVSRIQTAARELDKEKQMLLLRYAEYLKVLNTEMDDDS